MNRNLVFYTQASSLVGMGHLSRSLALMAEFRNLDFALDFVLDADARGQEAAAKMKGLDPLNALPKASGPIVIDAVDIPDSVVNQMLGFFPRILISPVCNRPDVATHVLSRNIPSVLRSSLALSTQVIIDSDFAFVTAINLSRKICKYDELRVGICLSGGKDLLDVKSLVNTIALAPSVREIYTISNHLIDFSSVANSSFHYSAPRLDPWAFLDRINVFIGGDGVMISEAIAQAIPVLSLTTVEGIEKNRELLKSGVMKVLLRDRFLPQDLTSFLSNTKLLESLHYASWCLNGLERSEKLKQTIIAILQRAKND